MNRRPMTVKPPLKMFLLTADAVQGPYGYYLSAVVVAASPKDATRIHPDGVNTWGVWMTRSAAEPFLSWGHIDDRRIAHLEGALSWVLPGEVTVRQVGYALPRQKPGVICASYNPG